MYKMHISSIFYLTNKNINTSLYKHILYKVKKKPTHLYETMATLQLIFPVSSPEPRKYISTIIYCVELRLTN